MQVDDVGSRQGGQRRAHPRGRLAVPDARDGTRHGAAVPDVGQAEFDAPDARMIEQWIDRPGNTLQVTDGEPELGEAAGGFEGDLLGPAARGGELGQDDDVHRAPPGRRPRAGSVRAAPS